MSPVEETPDLLDDLIRAGAPSHIVKRVAMLIAAEDAANLRRAKDAARKAEGRSGNKPSPRMSADTLDTAGQTWTAPLPPDGPPLPPSALPPSPPLNPPSPRNTARDELLVVLDEERAQAVIEHRQRIRKPLTAHAAKLLAGKFAKVADPNAAADAMISNGWQGFEPDWMERRGAVGPPQRAGNGTGFNGKPTLGDIRNAAKAAIAARDANGRPNLELLAGPDRRSGTGNGDNRPPDGVPRQADGPDGDRGDLLRGLLRVRAFPG